MERVALEVSNDGGGGGGEKRGLSALVFISNKKQECYLNNYSVDNFRDNHNLQKKSW